MLLIRIPSIRLRFNNGLFKMHTELNYIRLLFFMFLIMDFFNPIIRANNNSDHPAVTTIQSEIICRDCYGVKALLFNQEQTKIYSANLEGMSVYEFDRSSRKIQRKLKFIPNPGKGFNYTTKQWFDSYQEKPVELCLTHGRYLWISLHNAEGVVIWDLKENGSSVKDRPFKEAWLYQASDDISVVNQSSRDIKEKVRLLWIKTGSTPKVITASPDGKYLFVANWHSNTVSVLNIESPYPQDWMKVRDLNLSPIPRGMAVSADSRTLYVALMGSRYIEVIDLISFQKRNRIESGTNPRHLIIQDHQMFATLNSTAKLVRIHLENNQIDRVNTGRTPRTLVATTDGRFLFVTCYLDNTVQMFSRDSLRLLESWESSGHPVCVEVFQTGKNIEAWVGNHTSGTIKVFNLQHN